ncbi:helix-turn-helix domain-containing protein [Rhodococcus erythropolis]|uniref:helix-turn-helix domain-containing protein n=1 Tax=Rhodococcus erythropolis TaxID=1833 RepID=UPI00211F10B7|nr:helix-turn-helix domain-containing protein [Rhodococcus erythropolis]
MSQQPKNTLVIFQILCELSSVRKHDLAQRVAGNVRAELARVRMSQAVAATYLGISQAAFSRRLLGTIDFNLTEISRLSELLNVPVGDLIGEHAKVA